MSSAGNVLERGLQLVAGNKPLSDVVGVRWISGSSTVLSAPHSVAHERDGEKKREEGFTDALAAGVASSLGASAIWVVEGLRGDPNWDLIHPYKNRILDLSREGSLVVDLHVMRNRGFDVCLGLGIPGHLREVVWSSFAGRLIAQGLTVTLNYPFPAGSRTVTSFAQSHGRQAIQLEMVWDLVRPDGGGPLMAASILAACRSLEEALGVSH